MRTIILCLAFPLLFAASASGQSIWGSSEIDIDPDTSTVTATCSTEIDAVAAGAYNAKVTCSVTDGDGNLIQVQQGDDDGTGYAEATVTFTGTPGTTYNVTGQHVAFAYLDYAEYYDQPIVLGWADDPFNFSAFAADPAEYDNYFSLDGTGPEQAIRSKRMITAQTLAHATAPQIPTSLSAPTFQAVTSVTNGTVKDYFGQPLRTGYCGVYQNLASDLLDQGNPPKKIITKSDFTLTEYFSNYSSSYGGTIPPTQSFNLTAGQPLADIQSLGGPYPSQCLGLNDNEAFDMTFKVTLEGKDYTLTTVRHVSKGSFNGTQNVTVTTTTP
jgi:hypothetical protein